VRSLSYNSESYDGSKIIKSSVHGSIPHHERNNTSLHNARSVRPEVYPPSAAPEATRVSKGERTCEII
jgi:hypothetical protein